MALSISFDESFDRFESLFAQIAKSDQGGEKRSTIVGEANHLAASIPNAAEASPEVCWSQMWDKPLYANVSTGVAKGWRDKSAAHLAGKDAWRAMKKVSGNFRIEKTASGKRSPENFKALGAKAQMLVDMDVPIERIYSIICAAEALTKWAEVNPFPLRGVNVDVETVRHLSAELDYGWGAITTLHFLTDMGLACKPDMHLNATCRYLGFEINDVGNPNLFEAIEIVNFVRSLITRKFGGVSPSKLRFVDKCLMEASKRQLIPVMSRYPKEESWLAVELDASSNDADIEFSYRWKVDGVTIDQGRAKNPEGVLRSDLRAIEDISKNKELSRKNIKKNHVYQRIIKGISAKSEIFFTATD